MRFSVSFSLFLAVLIVSPGFCSSLSGIIKIVIVGDPHRNDTQLRDTVDSIALFIAKNRTKAPQIYDHTDGDACEFIGGVDRAKMRSDYILIVKKNSTEKLNCELEWGRQSFSILNFLPSPPKSAAPRNSDMCPNTTSHFHALLAFSSSEHLSSDKKEISWKRISCAPHLLTVLWPHFLAPQSRIPEEYSFKAEREERMKRRTLKAVIALMSLVVCSLLVIMFLGSLARYKESQKAKDQENQKKKQIENAPLAPPTTAGGSAHKESEKSMKSKEPPVEKSAKTEKSAKSEETKKLLSEKKEE